MRARAHSSAVAQIARVARRQHVDPRHAGRDRVRDRRVVDDAAVHERLPVDLDRREHARNRGTRHDRVDRVPRVSATSRPEVTSVATTHNGIGASSSRSKRTLRATIDRSLSGGTRDSRRPRKPSSPRSGRKGKTSRVRSDAQTAARSSSRARSASPATQAALSAPADAPNTRSGRMPRSARACSIPTWIAPWLAPPESTNAVVTDHLTATLPAPTN